MQNVNVNTPQAIKFVFSIYTISLARENKKLKYTLDFRFSCSCLLNNK